MSIKYEVLQEQHHTDDLEECDPYYTTDIRFLIPFVVHNDTVDYVCYCDWVQQRIPAWIQTNLLEFDAGINPINKPNVDVTLIGRIGDSDITEELVSRIVEELHSLFESAYELSLKGECDPFGLKEKREARCTKNKDHGLH